MSLSYPITNPKDLGLGQIGGGTEAPGRVRALGLIAADIGTATPAAAQYSASIWLGASSAPSGLTGQTPGSWFWDTTTPGDIYVTDASGVPQPFVSNGAVSPSAPINFPQGVALTFATNKDSLSRDATDFTWTHTTGDLIIDNTDVNDQIILRVGTDTTATGIELRNNSDVACWSFNPISASAGRLIGLDDCTVIWGTGSDLTISHNGTDSLIANVTGDLKITNTVATKGFVFKGGTATSATYFKILDSADQVQFQVLNDGSALLDGTLTAGGLTTAGTVQVSDGGLLLQVGSGTGTGDKIACLGVDATHGIATYVYEATVSPAAIETALFTVPVMSVIDSVQANVESVLTGGGTTVTFGVGITGDVDAYGTASNSGVQADLLTKNAKINTLGTTTNAGASIGVWSAGTVALKLIGAATGGAAAGDTALTVGSVKIRVVYRTLLPLADAP